MYRVLFQRRLARKTRKQELEKDIFRIGDISYVERRGQRKGRNLKT